MSFAGFFHPEKSYNDKSSGIHQAKKFRGRVVWDNAKKKESYVASKHGELK